MKRIAVIGMGRSGTSFITQFLSECGVYVDEVGDKFEHTLTRQINDAILEQEFGAKHGLPYGKLPDAELELSEKWHKKTKEFIAYIDAQAAEKSTSPYLAFKDPRTTVLHTLWIDYFDIVVGIYRRPEQVVESFLSKKWITGWRAQRTALNYWMRFNQSLLHVAAQRGGKPMFVVDYNADMNAQTARLGAALGLPVPENARAVFNPERNHFGEAKPLHDAAADAMYARLQQLRNLM